MPHKTRTVEQGDCISSIAFENGLSPDTIWNDPKNKKLKEERKDPNVLMPGDVVQVRSKERREESCASETKHSFRRKGGRTKLVVRFTLDDKPRKDEVYVLEIDGNRVGEGATRTDGEGKVEVPMEPNAKRGKITFPDAEEEYEIRLGHLDPITELSGIQGRLEDLGFYDGPLDGKPGEAVSMAVAAFQRFSKIEETGELDDDTRESLRKAFGG